MNKETEVERIHAQKVKILKRYIREAYPHGKELLRLVDEIIADLITTHDQQLWERMEGMKGDSGALLDTFKEGYKSGYNAGITDAQALLSYKK